MLTLQLPGTQEPSPASVPLRDADEAWMSFKLKNTMLVTPEEPVTAEGGRAPVAPLTNLPNTSTNLWQTVPKTLLFTLPTQIGFLAFAEARGSLKASIYLPLSVRFRKGVNRFTLLMRYFLVKLGKK